MLCCCELDEQTASRMMSDYNIDLGVGLVVLALLIKIIFLTVLIHNLKTAWPTKIAMPFLCSLDSLLQDAYIIFSKRC